MATTRKATSAPPLPRLEPVSAPAAARLRGRGVCRAPARRSSAAPPRPLRFLGARLGRRARDPRSPACAARGGRRVEVPVGPRRAASLAFGRRGPPLRRRGRARWTAILSDGAAPRLRAPARRRAPAAAPSAGRPRGAPRRAELAPRRPARSARRHLARAPGPAPSPGDRCQRLLCPPRRAAGSWAALRPSAWR